MENITDCCEEGVISYFLVIVPSIIEFILEEEDATNGSKEKDCEFGVMGKIIGNIEDERLRRRRDTFLLKILALLSFKEVYETTQ